MFLLFIFHLPSLVFAHIGYSTQSYCLDGIQADNILLECPSNQLIKLGRIIYGYSWSNDCSYIDKDCTMDVPREDIICLTTSNCTVHVVEHPLILQDCWNLAASYVQAEYECVSDYSLQNICQPHDITMPHGFISTPNYPQGFSSNLNCHCTLSAPLGHSIVLEIINFHLLTCAEAGLLLWIGQDFQTKCLTQEPITLISNLQQNIILRFYTLRNTKHGGFLMKYSASPESNNATVRLQCYLATAISRSTIKNSSSTLKPFRRVQNIIDHGNEREPSITNPSESLKRFQDVEPALNLQTNTLSNYEQQQLQSFNESNYKKYLLMNPTSLSRLNTSLIIIFIIAIVVFLIIINILIWFICSLRARSAKSTSSVQDLYTHQLNTNSEIKKTIHPQFSQPSNRLKTLHSLLYADHKAADMDPMRTNLNDNIDSSLSEYHIPSKSSSVSLNHGFIIKSKSNETVQEIKHINSWDDI